MADRMLDFVMPRPMTSLLKRVVGPAAVASLLALGGCAEGTEVNGKIFDLLGVSSSSQAAARSEPKMQVRAGLVLPPDASRLPEPGSDEAAAETAAINGLDDPEKRRAQAALERERLHKQYCSGELSWKDRVRNPDELPKSPYGPCGIAGKLTVN